MEARLRGRVYEVCCNWVLCISQASPGGFDGDRKWEKVFTVSGSFSWKEYVLKFQLIYFLDWKKSDVLLYFVASSSSFMLIESWQLRKWSKISSITHSHPTPLQIFSPSLMIGSRNRNLIYSTMVLQIWHTSLLCLFYFFCVKVIWTLLDSILCFCICYMVTILSFVVDLPGFESSYFLFFVLYFSSFDG